MSDQQQDALAIYLLFNGMAAFVLVMIFVTIVERIIDWRRSRGRRL